MNLNSIYIIIFFIFLLFVMIIVTGELIDKVAIIILSVIWMVAGYFLGKSEK